MENKLFEELDGLNIKDTTLLLDKHINLSVDYFTKKRIEKSIKKKIGYDNMSNMLAQKINDILGGIFMKRKIALALGVCTILGSGGGAYAYVKTPVAYVSMDINPSVELGVNVFNKVVSVEAYNKDGEKILEGTNLVRSEVDHAINIVISNAISEGYIKEDGSSSIEITTSTDKEKVATQLDESLKEVVDETLNDNNVEAEVETEKVAIARRDEARKLGITPGKLNIIQKLKELDSTINVEDYKDSSVKDIQKKTKELRKNNESDEVTTDQSTNIDTNTNAVNNENIDNSSNIGNSKKEENSNSNSKKDESNNANDTEKDTTTKSEKQNNSNNLNLQNNNNSNSQNNNSSNSQSNNNSNSQNNSSNKEKNN